MVSVPCSTVGFVSRLWRMRRAARCTVAFATVPVVVSMAASGAFLACSQTPTSVPVRTFERAQRMDVACVQLYDAVPNGFLEAREPLGRPQGECAPVAPTLAGGSFQKQLFALVTQTTRGELAVVDLSAGTLVDQSRAIPGVNFIPVGALPTDIATAPDGKMVFVSSAETNKPAIYGIPTRRILGDTDGFPHDSEPASLASWPVCALPQNPGSITIVPRSSTAVTGGTSGSSNADPPDYEIVVVLPGDRRHSAKVVALDPRPFVRGGLRRKDGQPDYGSDTSVSVGPVLQPGSLAECPILSAVELEGAEGVPTSFVPGQRWDRGVPYVDGGVDLSCSRPASAARCAAAPCCGAEGGLETGEAPDGGACAPALDSGLDEEAKRDAGSVPFELGPLDPPRLVSVVRDEQTLYIADEALPFIHVLDMSTPGQPRELPPLLATSVTDPGRRVKVQSLAISPPTRDYKRFLYAVDQSDGSIMVYDVSAPNLETRARTPERRPFPELNPFQPSDRIAFNSPVVAIAFARHDVPLTKVNGSRLPSAASGLLCNPNANVDASPQADLGFYYRADSTDVDQLIGPRRLRGVFAFATLANGQVITINVDDWDAPCRRPVDMSAATSDVTPAQPLASSASDLDPYHAPITGALSVTNEGFFPMSAPHSLRSEVLVRDDARTGNLLPRLQTIPTVTSNGVLLPQTGAANGNTPRLSFPNLAREVPQAHIDQDWRITWEGVVPGFDGASGVFGSNDDYASLVLSQPTGRFCAKGVEDWAQGTERASRIKSALVGRGVAPPSDLGLITDYVQLTEEILPEGDPYWDVAQACWDPQLATGSQRQSACQKTFGAAADQNTQRDFPILEAYDDKVVLGRYFTRDLASPNPSGPVGASSPTVPSQVATKRREVVYKDPTNARDLKLAQCCFHGQARFRVRTGQLWSVVGTAVNGGSGVGFFSHMAADAAGRCVASCDSREALLNGRAPLLPNGITSVERNSVLGVRNPMLSFFLTSGTSGSVPLRDTQYAFATGGQFRALSVAIGGASASVNPQSMRYIEALGQIAVVDAASQGLVLIDLRTVTVARAPYF